MFVAMSMSIGYSQTEEVTEVSDWEYACNHKDKKQRNGVALNYNERDLCLFSEKQKDNLKFACEQGKTVVTTDFKEEELCYIFSGIIWAESGSGNIDPLVVRKGHYSYGYFQNNINTVRTRLKWIGYNLTNQEIINMLSKKEVSALYAKIEFMDWNKRRKGNLNQIIASYNAGNKWQNGSRYSKDVQNKMNVLKKWNSELKIND